MAQEKNSNIQKTKRELVLKLYAFLGICCFLQFFVVTGIAVVRGYSVESDVSTVSNVVCLVGIFFILPHYSGKRRATIAGYFISLWLIYNVLANVPHGGYLEKGNVYYSQGRYPKALQACKKESQTWYRRLQHNPHEKGAMLTMAKTYCQLEDFDNARVTYKLMIARYSGSCPQAAEDNLKRLEKGLLLVANYSGQVPEGLEEVWKWYDLARTYQYDLICYKKALEMCRQIIDTNISEEFKEVARKQIEAMTIPAVNEHVEPSQ